MSIDKLQNGIRKLKNPSVVAFSLDKMQIPPEFMDTANGVCDAYCQYAKSLLEALNGLVSAVRFGFGSFAVAGADGMETLKELLAYAEERGFYVLLDVPEIYSALEAALMAETFLNVHTIWKFDALVLSCYIGSDAVKPFADRLKDNDKDLFLLLRSGNKSASELQDLLTGSRLVYTAAADMAKRLGEGFIDRCGYSRIAGIGPGTSTDSLRSLRSKYPAMFLLVDGYDYSGANAKNCSFAFDKLGHGAVACAGSSIVAAWKEENADSTDAAAYAVQAAERMKKNLTRYVTIL